MAYPFAAIVWDMVLPMQTFDETQMFAFYSAYAEQFNPEKQVGCVQPSASPGAAPTTAPSTASPAPSTAAPSASTAPAAS
jgi:hypothetical protein